LPDDYSSAKKTTSNKNFPDTTNTKKTPVKTALGFTGKHLTEIDKMAKQKVSADTINAQKTSVKTASAAVSKQILSPDKQPDLANNKQDAKSETDNLSDASFIRKKNESDSLATKNEIPALASTDSSKQKKSVAVTKNFAPSVANLSVTNKATKSESVNKPSGKPSAFSLGLYAGPHLNYANGSNNQLGLGAGVSTAFRLSKNLKLSTGLALLQNNLTYGQTVPHGSLDAASSSYTAAMPSSTVSISTPSLSSMDASLVALDVPLNLTYSFLPGKNSIAISAGVSSNTFVKEAYDYHYSNSTSTAQNIKAFNNFNFAKMLNISAGFAYPLGKNKLQVEPFLKYPLGGLGSQQLLFGSAGINLKMNFQSVKK